MMPKRVALLSLLVLLAFITSAAVAGPSCEMVSIAAGSSHSLAVNRDGRVLAWGNGGGGALGLGFFIREDQLVPVPVPSLEGATAVTACPVASLALASSPSPWAWGNNQGQFGDGTVDDSYVPVTSSGITDVSRMACGGIWLGGGGHVFALRTDGVFGAGATTTTTS